MNPAFYLFSNFQDNLHAFITYSHFFSMILYMIRYYFERSLSLL